MSPSRKTAARSAAASEQPASWHALEVPVPETSRLAPVAGGLPGRVPPQANTLTRSLVAALAEIAACRTGAAWLVAPSRRVGQEWVETVVRLGHPVANLNVTTLPALAFDIVADTLAASGTALAPPRAKLVAVERVLDESRADLESFRDFAGPWRRLAERVLASVEAIRAAGLAAGDVVGGLGRTAKARDLGRILDRYEAALRGLNLVDQPGELALAIDHVAAGRVPPAIALVLVPDDIDPPPLERKLLAALGSAPGVTVRTLATDPPLAAAPAAIDASHVSIFRAAGESNEVRHVLRTAVARGLRFDEIEIVHTDAATYPALVREIVAALPRPAEPAAGHLPVTFAEGLPLADSKPGRALSGWLAWRRDGHPQSGLERLLRDGVIDIAGLVPDAPRSSTLVRALRGVKIGRGLDRTVSMLAAAATRAAEQPAAAFARGWRDDDEPLGDSTPEELAARKARIAGRLSALAALGRVLAQCEGTGAAEPAAVAVLRGARRFVHDLCAADSEFDGNARRMILDEIDAMLTWRGDHGAATAHDMLEWLAHLPEELVVLGSGPRPGCLHVSGLAGGGHSGRPYTFVLGLDENRFPGGGATDPVLTDGDRALLNAAQPLARLVVSRDAAARNLDLWRRLLTRLRGEVWLGFSCRDAADDAEVFPSPALVAYHAQAEGRPLVTVDEFLHTLPPPTALVPADPDLALDESQWWLATLSAAATPAAVQAALAAHRGHLGHGQAAVAARATTAFTPHDGLVPAAGPLLDPRGGRAASPNSLETLAACPRRFFFRYGLGVEPIEEFDEDTDRWLTPLDAGSLLHTVLERFMRGLIDREELPDVDRHLADLLAILDEELAASRQRQPPLTELAFVARRDELRTALHTFLHDEARSCRESGRRPFALEAAIGVEPAGAATPFDTPEPVAVPLAPGETIRLRGRIDRIDVRDSAAGPAYTLWDYKSGSSYGFPAAAATDPFLGGRKLQHGLYVVMLGTRLADPACAAGGGEVERFGYFFPTRAGKGRRLEWTAAQLADCTRLVRQLAEIVRQGVFLPTEDDADCGFCDFLTVCGSAARVTHDATRMLAASEPLRDLFGLLRGEPRPRPVPEVRRPHEAPLALTPHPPVPVPPPDEPVRARIRTDLGTTLLVEAAAGTGKTTCIVARMLALVRAGAARPEGIVAVTFTKKAAAELRRRFREQLQRAVAETTDPDEQSRFATALERIDSMMIGTIHSFAGRLLRERPLEAGVDPGFRELDEAGDRLLRRQAWREFVTAAPTDHPQLLADLAAVGLRLGDLAGLFVERFATYGDVGHWPAPATDPPDVAAVVGAVEAFVRRIEGETFPDPAARGTDQLMSALEQFARMTRRCDTSSVVAVMDLLQELDHSPKVTQGSWPGGGATPAETRAAKKAAAIGWQEAWERLRDTVARPALTQWRAHRYPTAIAALTAALAVYDRLRADRGVLSFQDLLCKAAGLLAVHPEVRRSFRHRYTHILVDEFQDTDPVQAEMLLLLTAGDPRETDWRKCVPAAGSLFVVGDPKQSLYRFRRADIVTYAAVRRIIAGSGDVLALTTNFRSRGDLVAWTNDVFTAEFPPEATVESPTFTPSTSGRREAAPTGGERGWLTGIRTLRFVRSGTAGGIWSEREAREIAAFIRAAIDAGMAVPRTSDEAARGVTTACRPGDFLIVARERKHLGIYAAALHAAGLPVDVTGTLGEDQAEPLRDLRACLAALADPDDPVAVLALLRGPVFGFSDAELFAYKQAGGRFTGPIDVPAGLEPALAERFTAAREAFGRWRAWLRQLPVAATVERLCDDAGIWLIAAVADGEAGPRGRAVAGLVLKYVERLRAERLEVVSLHDCIDLLDDLIGTSTREEFDPLTIDVPSTDRVRVMNLHKAKGLEAPVVFLADYQKRKTGTDATDGPSLHVDRTGDRTTGWLAVTQSVGWTRKIVAAPAGWEALCEQERAFEEAEQIRLDYVAATRAGCGLVVSLFEKAEKAAKGEPETFVAEGAWGRFAPHLAAVADLPTITPVTGRPAPTAAGSGPVAIGATLGGRIAACLAATFGRISPRELLTEPAEGIRFTGDGLGEPWGRAIHRLIEMAARDPRLNLDAAAATVLSGEEVSLAHHARAVATVREVLASPVWQRAQASRTRFVEVPFSVQVRGADLPARVRTLAGDGEPLPTVIRGVIDLVFAEAAGGWTVVDWKTDAVTRASEGLLEDHYRPQVELYADCWRLLPYNAV